jgi:hypothetical protein
MYRENEDRAPDIGTLYPPDEIIPIPFDDEEFDLQAGNGQSLHFENGRGLKRLGREFLLADVAFYDPNIPMGSTIVFEMKGSSLNVVPDESEEIIAAYDAAEEAEYAEVEADDEEDITDDDFGSKSATSFDNILSLMNAKGQRFPFRKVAGLDHGKGFYLILNPQFHIPGFDADDALVYEVLGTSDNHRLSLILDENIVSGVFDQYYRLLDSKHKIGGHHDDDDDLF